MPKVRVHYFSSTGNSQLAAEVITAGLQRAGWEASLKDIRTLKIEDETEDIISSDLIGFVFPIYAFRAAIIMEEHIQALPASKIPRQVFFAATYAGYLDRAFMRLRDFLVPKNYFPVAETTLICEDSWTAIRIPGTMYDTGWPEKASLKRLFDFSEKNIPQIWKQNADSPKAAICWVPFNPITLIAATFPIAIRRGKQFPIFVKKSLCTKCGKCASQCPTGRLKMMPFPKAQGNCIGCYGCINSCPVEAINTWFTNGRSRYRGPRLKLSDLLAPESQL
ncbi:MAG: EFR1 family ferrodoxin [Candidatus Riflebacteria bacterium]|nr:EFR1 family ferrodoxin [Candidatus Riflebacteria bacterium]